MQIDLEKYPLDSEVLGYLEKCEALNPGTVDQTGQQADVIQDRRDYLHMCKAFEAPIADGIRISDRNISGRYGEIPVRLYQPDEPATDLTLIYFHGGGFVLGNLDSHNSLCAEFADRCRCEVVAVDYRLAPEHIHPASFNDALDVFIALDKGRTIVAGDSAGGNLAAAVCIAQRESESRPVGQVLVYPWLGGEMFDLDSYNRNYDAPGLTVRDLVAFRNLRSTGEPEYSDPTYYPLALNDYTGLPPCIAFAAEYDPLCDDAGCYVDRLTAADVTATCHIDRGLIHGHLRARHMSEKVSHCFARICEAIRELDTGTR